LQRGKTVLAVSLLSASLLVIRPLPGSAYQVQPGDTLWGISSRYGISLASLEEANGLSDASVLRIGQHLTIPGQDPPAASPYARSTTTYTVQPGDSLWSIAERYGTSVGTLMSLNHLDSDFLLAGSVLRVPEGPGSPPSAETSRGMDRLDEVAAYALRFQGVPYVYAGESPQGFDCSGFVRYVLARFGIYVAHSSYAQYQVGVPVPASQLEPGDLVFFNTYGPISHVGIYVGNGRFISATCSRGVAVESLDDAYWGPRFAGARRL